MGTVLYIDDDSASRALVARIFTRRPDLQLVTASSGAEGVRRARDDAPDLVLSDLQLSDRTGLDVVVELLADSSTRHLPIVIISGDSSPERIDELLAAGAVGYITKPFTVVHLLEVIDTHLGTSAPAAPSAAPRPTSERTTIGHRASDDPLDRAVLADLRDAHERSGQVAPIIERFLSDSEGLIARLRHGLQDGGDTVAVEEAAHRLAGSAGMFSAHLVAGRANTVERHAAKGELGPARAALAELEAELRRAVAALREEIVLFTDPELT